MKQTSQRSLLFRQNVNRTEAEWVHFLDGYRKALIEFDMKKFGDDWHTAEDIVEEIFLNIVREPRITALRPQDSFRHVLINMCMQKHKSFTKPWRRRLAERLSVALCLTMRTQDDARREIAAGFLDLVLADLADATRDALGQETVSPRPFPRPFPHCRYACNSAADLVRYTIFSFGGAKPLNESEVEKCPTQYLKKRLNGLTKRSRTLSFCSFVFFCLKKLPPPSPFLPTKGLASMISRT